MLCPYCSTVINHRESDRRALDRVTTQINCEILRGNVTIPARTIDISDTGLGIKMRGYLPFEANEEVNVYIAGFRHEKKARVVWTKRSYGTSRAGLTFC
jgi:c-di-GMP-binding flagellar brake protein YcgR